MEEENNNFTKKDLHQFLASLLILVIYFGFYIGEKEGIIFPVTLNVSSNVWPEIITAIVTFFAVLVALFQEKLKRHFNHTKVAMNINFNPPDCHIIELTNHGSESRINGLYVRIKVQHTAGGAAENTEIMLAKAWRKNSSQKWEIMPSFLPLSLVWSHFQPRTNLQRIPIGLFRHCDLGFLFYAGERTLFQFTTIINPNKIGGKNILPNVFVPGEYKIEMVLTGDNVEPVKKNFYLKFDGKWSEEESVLMAEHFNISEVEKH